MGPRQACWARTISTRPPASWSPARRPLSSSGRTLGRRRSRRPYADPAGSSSRAAAFQFKPSSPRSTRSRRPLLRDNQGADMPGLLRGVARTAAIAGTATAVSNRVSRRQAARWGQQDSYPAYEEAPVAAAPVAGPDPVAQLRDLAQLRDDGILT